MLQRKVFVAAIADEFHRQFVQVNFCISQILKSRDDPEEVDQVRPSELAQETTHESGKNWGCWDSNPEPKDYESSALTVELQPRLSGLETSRPVAD